MEFAETPTFWCPHVDRAACTNFSPRTVELRPPESQEIFPFLFSPFLSFSFFFSFLLSRILFVPTNCFLLVYLFAFCFSFFSFSHLIFPLFLLLISLPFSLCFSFSLPFWSIDRMGQKEEVSSPLPQAKCVAFHFPIFIPYFFISFMTSYPTWLNMSHGIMPPMWLNVSHSFYAKCHTLEVPCGIPLPCHVSSDTPRLEKREIPTTSEFNEIRHGS